MISNDMTPVFVDGSYVIYKRLLHRIEFFDLYEDKEKVLSCWSFEKAKMTINQLVLKKQ